MTRQEFVDKMELVVDLLGQLGFSEFVVAEDGDVNVVVLGTKDGIHSAIGNTEPWKHEHFAKQASH